LNPWSSKNWKRIYANKKTKQGIITFFDDSIDKNIINEFHRFNQWLTSSFDFPVRIKLMLINTEKVQMSNGAWVYGMFKYFSSNRYPIIKIPVLSNEINWEIEELLGSYVHELTHYFQWINRFEQTEDESERQANYYRYRIIQKYYFEIGKDF